MKFALAVGGLVLAMCGSAQASVSDCFNLDGHETLRAKSSLVHGRVFSLGVQVDGEEVRRYSEIDAGRRWLFETPAIGVRVTARRGEPYFRYRLANYSKRPTRICIDFKL